MNYQKFFPSKYISAVDLDGMEDSAFTIRELREEEVQNQDGGTEQKPVLRFEETAKGLILNRTNADMIAGLYGSDIEGWIGKRIVLYVERDVHAFGKKWDVIRIRNHVPPAGNGFESDGMAGNGGSASNASLPTQDDLAF